MLIVQGKGFCGNSNEKYMVQLNNMQKICDCDMW